MTQYRVRWDFDPMPDMSWLEQWDTPEKYYDVQPVCPLCDGSVSYTSRHNFACDDEECCGFVCVIGPGQFVAIASGPNSGVVIADDGKPVPFEVYKEHWGDPGQHAVLCCVVESACECCGSWVVQASLSGIDFMVTDSFDTGTFDEAQVTTLTGYQLEVSQELIAEAKNDGGSHETTTEAREAGLDSSGAAGGAGSPPRADGSRG
jgi:hypothetical protein